MVEKEEEKDEETEEEAGQEYITLRMLAVTTKSGEDANQQI